MATKSIHLRPHPATNIQYPASKASCSEAEIPLKAGHPVSSIQIEEHAYA